MHALGWENIDFLCMFNGGDGLLLQVDKQPIGLSATLAYFPTIAKLTTTSKVRMHP